MIGARPAILKYLTRIVATHHDAPSQAPDEASDPVCIEDEARAPSTLAQA